MKLSVLMSVYEKEQPAYLFDALNSISSQTLLPDEIVIVKDGPLNAELDNIIELFSQEGELASRTKVVSLEKNHGLGEALNRGLAVCTGSLIARVDSDDISLPNRFQTQVSFLKKNPSVIVVGSNILEFDELMANILAKKSVPETNSEISRYIKSRNPFNHMSVMYRKSQVIESGGYEHCPYFEDYFLWLKLFSKGANFHNIQRTLVNARTGSSMISRRGGWRYSKSIINFYAKALKLDNALSLRDASKSLLQRLPVAMIPGRVRTIVYKWALRRSA